MLRVIVGSAEATAYYEDVDLAASNAKIMQSICNVLLSISIMATHVVKMDHSLKFFIYMLKVYGLYGL